jgi:hypothetical protein
MRSHIAARPTPSGLPITSHSLPSSQSTLSGTSRVHTRWRAHFADVTNSSRGRGRLQAKGFWLTEHDVFGNDDHVCALSIMGARRSGVDVQTRVVSVFDFRDGQQLERCFYPEDGAAWDQIFAE